ncbi:sensor histidine kinase [Kocuria atrinae]|uniref:Oxygen sensor histidine kinase NreB n=1 Tax=Kocuria atrinae TaxID=592377 RepID=A0ABN2XJA1_9MICC
METTSTARVLRVLRLALHLSFAGLLFLGVLRMASDPPMKFAWSLCLACLLAAVYLVGTVWENRYAHGRSDRNPRFLAIPWLAVISVLWGALVLMSADFISVVFPLFFLFLLLLPRAVALACVVLLTGVVILSQRLHIGGDEFTSAMVYGPALGAVFAVIMASSYRAMYQDVLRYQRTLTALENTRSELARTERAAGQATERERLAREIHDTLAQGLSSIVLMSRAARSSLSEDDVQRTDERLGTIETAASENLAEARRFVHNLSSPALAVPLSDALRQLCERTTQQARARGDELTVTFSEDRTGQADFAQQTVLLRAAQTLLANVAAHAHARQAVVSLSWWDHDVSVDVVDNGVGFNPEQLPPRDSSNGFGLPALHERVTAAGGTATVESAPGDGTAVNVRIPLKPPRVSTSPDVVAPSADVPGPHRSPDNDTPGETS